MPVEKSPAHAIDHHLSFDLESPWLGRAVARNPTADHDLGVACCTQLVAHQAGTLRQRYQRHPHAGKARTHASVDHAAVPRPPAQRAHQAAWPAPTLLERGHLVEDFVGHGVVCLALVA